MANVAKYVNLLEAILQNAENLRDSAILLLENTPAPDTKTPVPNQSYGIHAQHFIYLGLEELGKFFLILDQYDANLDNISLRKLGFENHDTKIGYLISYVNRYAEKKSAGLLELPQSFMVRELRKFKELNVYVQYKDGEIIVPIPNRGNGRLESSAKALASAMDFANACLSLFRKNPSYFKERK